MNTNRSFQIATAAVLVLAIGLGLSAALNWQERGVVIGPRHQRELQSQLEHESDFTLKFRKVAKSVLPSVVGIKGIRRRAPDEAPPEQTRKFEGLPEELEHFHRQYPFRRPQQRERNGSGVIVEVKGSSAYVLTNEHVVRGADEITVNLSDGRRLRATLKGEDAKTDLAVVVIKGHDLIPVRMGDSDRLEVGDWVLAFGNPFGLSHTVTSGIISAKGRSDVRVIENRQAYENFIQTDAAINPGNSGGPLVDLHAKVIGINTAIASRSGGSQGVGFAIPVNLAKKIYAMLRDHGRVSRGWIGVSIDPLTEEQAKGIGLKAKGGILVRGVFSGEPAAKAGVRTGDVIIKFGDTEVLTVEELRFATADKPVGSSVEVRVFRKGEVIPVEIIITEQPSEERLARLSLIEDQLDFGLSVQELTPELAKELGHEGAEGVLVADVAKDSPAYAKGIRSGALIQVIRQGESPGWIISTVQDYEKVLKKIDAGQPVEFKVRLQGATESETVVIE